jgi:hypothetical protein
VSHEDPAPAPKADTPDSPPSGGRWWGFRRWTRRGWYLVVAVVAAVLVSLFTIDLGPQLRTHAERRASAYLERPMHIGAIRAQLWSGRFILEDVVIEGRTPDAVPFLKADRLLVSIPWWSLFRRDLVLEVEMDRWALQIESWEGYVHNLPRILPRTTRDGPGPVATTVNFVFGRNGHFRYIDHFQPWDITADDLELSVVRARGLNTYVARLGITGGEINIMDYEPMRLDALSARMSLDGGLIRVHQMDLVADGSRSRLEGIVDTARWPEQEFRITSDLDIARIKELFFHGQDFTASGRGHFVGEYHKYQRGGHEVTGKITSSVMRVSGLDFPKLAGHVVWVPNRLEVVGTESEFYGGSMRLAYALDSRGRRGSLADLSMTYRGVDLMALGRVWGWEGIALASRANGWHAMQWPSGRFEEMAGEGVVRATPTADRALAAPVLPAIVVYAQPEAPFLKDRLLDPQPVGGEVAYRMTPTEVEFDSSWAATPETHVAFSGRTGWRDSAEIPFRVVSTDWQASNRLLAGVLTAFGSKTGAVEIGGRGEFDGVLTQWFNKPHIAGHLKADGIRAWDVTWGRGSADLVIENSYVTVSNSLVEGRAEPDATEAPVPRMVANGRYSLGYPRADGGEQFDARIRVDDWPITDFRHAFLLDDWPVTGTTFADLRLYGDYEGPEGFGLIRVSPGSGWEETFDSFTGRMSFERVGVRLDGIEVTKSTGIVRGAAYVGWASPANNNWGTYSFTFDGERIPVESLVSFTVPDADLTGVLSFRMFGSGTNERPRWEWDGRVVDLFWGDEGIGQATAHMVVEQDVVRFDRLEVASDRLSISGSGQVSMTDEYGVEATLRFTESSVDPFLRFAAPGLSPYTRAVVSGAVRLSGELSDLSRLGVDLTIDKADLALLDFELTNPIGPDGTRIPLQFSFRNDALAITAFRLTGEGTSLVLGGGVNRATEAIDVTVDGTSNLAILQGVIQDVRASGVAAISARIGGTLSAPTYGGDATLSDGRLRHYSFPHSLDDINGRVTFDASGVRVDGLRARMGTGGRSGTGDIQFGGTIGLSGFLPGDLDITAKGDGLDLRYPEGFRSIVDADLAVTGSIDNALVSGRVTVRQARYTRRLAGNVGLLGLAAGGGDAALSGAPGAPTDLPLSFAVDLVGQRLIVIDDADATVVVSPDLRLTGTLDRPQLAGRVEIDRGETEFLGNRYTVGGYVEFANPNEIEPYFDLEARTQIRLPYQDYRIDLRFTGTMARFSYDLSSDPPLTQVDVLSLMLGQSPDLQRAELRALGSPQETQNQLMSSVLAQLVTSPITSQVGRVVERTLNVDTFTVTPLLSTDAALQQLPNARITVGKKISNRVFLTYSRSLDSSTSLDYELLLLEYAQNDRMSWVLSRNQDGTFALDFRVRYRF